MQPDYPVLPDHYLEAHCRHLTRPDGVAMVSVLVSSGVAWPAAYALECRDVHEMALMIARSRQWAKVERSLVAKIPDRPLPTPSWLSMHRSGATIAATVGAFLLCLLTVWHLA